MQKGSGSPDLSPRYDMDEILSSDESQLINKTKIELNEILAAVGRGQPASTRNQQLVQLVVEVITDVKSGRIEIPHPQTLSPEELMVRQKHLHGTRAESFTIGMDNETTCFHKWSERRVP